MTSLLLALLLLFGLIYLGRSRPDELRDVAGALHGRTRDLLESGAGALGNGTRFFISTLAGPLFWLDPRVTAAERSIRHTAGRAAGRVLMHLVLAAFGLLALYADYVIQTLSLAAITGEAVTIGHLGLGVAGWTALTWVGGIGFFGALALDLVGITPGDVLGFERRDARGGRTYKIVLASVLVILFAALLGAPLAAWLRVDMLGGTPGAQGFLGHYVMTVVSTLPALVTAIALVVLLFSAVMLLSLPPALVGVVLHVLEQLVRGVLALLDYAGDMVSTTWSLVDGRRAEPAGEAEPAARPARLTRGGSP